METDEGLTVKIEPATKADVDWLVGRLQRRLDQVGFPDTAAGTRDVEYYARVRRLLRMFGAQPANLVNPTELRLLANEPNLLNRSCTNADKLQAA